MKLAIFSEAVKQEPSIYLRLVQTMNMITLEVVDPKTGLKVTCGELLYIEYDGKIRLARGISDTIGLPLDKLRRITLTD